MYCGNCAHEITKEAIACPKCGVPPGKGKNYCFYCGSATHEDAIICVSCGRSINAVTLAKNEIIYKWSKWAYSNYILILLFSLLSFANFKCGNERVFKVTGLNLATGIKKPNFFNTNTDRNLRRYKEEVVGNDDETIVVYELSAFYVLMTVCLIMSFTSIKKRFVVVRILTVIGLILVSEWFILSNIRLSESQNSLIDVSYGLGFWLTIIVLITSLVLLSAYIKLSKEKRIKKPIVPSFDSKSSTAGDTDINFTPDDRSTQRNCTIDPEAFIEPKVLPDNNVYEVNDRFTNMSFDNIEAYEYEYEVILKDERDSRLRRRKIFAISLLSLIIICLTFWFFTKSEDEAHNEANIEIQSNSTTKFNTYKTQENSSAKTTQNTYEQTQKGVDQIIISDSEINQIIRGYVNAQLNSDFDSISDYFVDNIKRYYDLTNPTTEQLKNLLNQRRASISNLRMDIENIKIVRRDNDIKILLMLNVAFFEEESKENITRRNVANTFILDNNGKIKSVF